MGTYLRNSKLLNIFLYLVHTISKTVSAIGIRAMAAAITPSWTCSINDNLQNLSLDYNASKLSQSRAPNLSRGDIIARDYLREHEPTFQELDDLRERVSILSTKFYANLGSGLAKSKR